MTNPRAVWQRPRQAALRYVEFVADGIGDTARRAVS
jgi:hypothetical protein